MNKYATAITIGCRLNQADTALIFDELKELGFEILPQKTDKQLSLIIINTCSVTASASQKSRQSARSMKKKYPQCFIIVTGCSVETETTWQSEECVDLIIPNADKIKIKKYLLNNETFCNKFLSSQNDKTILKGLNINSPGLQSYPGNNQKLTTNPEGIEHKCLDKDDVYDYDKGYDYDQNEDKDKENDKNNFSFENIVGFYPFKCRANIKIQDGCDSFCTYCIVPYGRGKPRSRNLDDTIREFKELVARGHKEIVLTGVNIAMYNDSGCDLTELLEKLIKIPGEYRIRLSSTEPQFSNHGLIEIMSSTDKICRFLHLPIQHGSDEILKRMGRNYTTKDFRCFVDKAVNLIPNICLGTDIITGFPGETDELFVESKSFIESLPLAYMHVFQYSKRKGTPAAEYPDQVHNKISTNRHKELSEVSSILDRNFLNKQIGKTLPVLYERKNKNGFYTGWSDNYVSVKIKETKKDSEKEKILNNILYTKINKISGKRELTGTIF